MRRVFGRIIDFNSMSRYRTLILILLSAAIVVIIGMMYFFVVRPYVSRQQPGGVANENANQGRLPATNGNANVPVVNESSNVNTLQPEAVVNVPIAPLPTTTLKEEYGVDAVANGDLTETRVVVPTRVDSATAGSGQDVVYHDPESGQFFRHQPDGTTTALSDAKFFNVQAITWSPAADKAVLEFPDNSKLLYDFNRKAKLDLPYYWQTFSFSNSGQELATKSVPADPENRYLTVMNTDGSNLRSIEPLGENGKDVQVAWSPDQQKAALYSSPLDATRREIFFIGLNGENFKSALVEGQGFFGKWTPDGEQLLYSTYKQDAQLVPTLYLMDAKGDDTGASRRSTGLNTWADRCAFSPNGRFAYCGVPTNLRTGAAIVPEYQKDTRDNIYQLELPAGTPRLLARPATIAGTAYFTVTQPFVSSDGKVLYFKDGDTGVLESIQLSE